MSDPSTIEANIVKIFDLLSAEYNKRSDKRPWVTLTWAQSLDGKLSTSSTSQTLISGSDSLQLTHSLRATHDGILVGSNTLVVDDPRLTTRLTETTQRLLLTTLYPLLSDRQHHSACTSPVPVILDSRLRTPRTARCMLQPHRPFIFCAAPAAHEFDVAEVANIVSLPKTTSGGLPLQGVLEHLKMKDVKSVMVEGGASVLSSFFAEERWDIAIVTVAPAVFGGGPSLQPPHHLHLSFANLRFARSHWFQFGDDIVLVGFPE